MKERNENSAKHEFKRLPAPIKITDQSWPEGTQPLVSILCITYNHEKYIKECLEGFLMQETTFPVEIIVHDDASTDRTLDIVGPYCQRYPDLFKTIFQETNQFSLGRKPTILAFPYASGKFIATCEGDDYWTLPLKLEKQIEVFDKNPICILCGGRVAVIRDEASTPYKIDPFQEPEVLAMLGPREMLKGLWGMRTVSRVTRREIWAGYVETLKGSLIACDYLFMLYCVSVSGMEQQSFRCLDEVVGVYRENEAGIWFSKTDRERDRINLDIVRYALSSFNFNCDRHFLEWTLYLTLKRNRVTLRDGIEYLKLKALFLLRRHP